MFHIEFLGIFDLSLLLIHMASKLILWWHEIQDVQRWGCLKSHDICMKFYEDPSQVITEEESHGWTAVHMDREKYTRTDGHTYGHIKTTSLYFHIYYEKFAENRLQLINLIDILEEIKLKFSLCRILFEFFTVH